MLKNNFKLLAQAAAVLVWMLLIFSFSSQPAVQSNRLSRSTATVITEVKSVITHGMSSPRTISHLNGVIRKAAHFFLYFVLGILVISILAQFKFSHREAFIHAIFICILYGALDEFHQFFVPGRGPGIGDVLIDAAGCAVGLLVFWFAERLLKPLSPVLKKE